MKLFRFSHITLNKLTFRLHRISKSLYLVTMHLQGNNRFFYHPCVILADKLLFGNMSYIQLSKLSLGAIPLNYLVKLNPTMIPQNCPSALRMQTYRRHLSIYVIVRSSFNHISCWVMLCMGMVSHSN